MGAHIYIPAEEIADFCKRHRISNLSLFGSVLRDDFRPDSDVDVLVEFESQSAPRLSEILDMKEELEQVFRRKVDIVTRRAVEQSPNYIRRRHILSNAESIYMAR